ncbi:EpsG family protein [Clostridium botulinum]|uniref:EpsG family protein n=1 Tax=Clostridium botulinum TaxID=1491 RepID=UPI0019670513|nr:EpsG family protein [Clostridium botulinum]
MVIYIVLLFLVYIFGVVFLQIIHNRKYFLFFSFASMATVLGLRSSSVGEDTQHFLKIFDISKSISWGTIFSGVTETTWSIQWGIDQKIENGYMTLNKVLHIFTDKGQWLLIVMAILTCWLVARFIYKNIPEHVFLATQIFLCESLYMNSFNLMRQILAISIGINAYSCIKDKKYIRALFIFLSAFMFHKSSLVLLIMIPLCLVKNNQKMIKYALISGFSISILMPKIASVISMLIPRYSSYFNVNYWQANINGTIILWVIEIGICLFMYIKKVKNKDTFMGVTCTILYLTFEIIGFNLSIFSRIALYFRVFLMILFSSFVNYISPKKRILYYILILLLITVAYMSYASSDARVYTFFWQ